MNWVLTIAQRYGRLVIAAAVGLVALTALQLHGAPVDAYPEFTPPMVQVQTEALGLAAVEVEQLVTVPLEQDLLNGVPWLDHMSSRSMPGLSVIDLVFDSGTDLYSARQMVQERMTQARVLPNVGSPPIMVQPQASTARVAMIGLTSSDVSLLEMSVLARWKVRPQLMGIPGVANVSIYGQRDRQLQVQVDPRKLQQSHVTLTQVIETAGNALWVSPLSFVEASTPGTGGFVESPNQRLAVQHVLPITTAQDLAKVPLQDHGAGSLRLGDVATVVEDHQPLIGDAMVDGSPSLYLVVDKFPGADTRQVTHDVDAALADMAPGLTGITVTTDAYRPANFLQSSLRSIGWAGLAALLLLVLVLVVLLTWRAAVVAVSAVVVSLSAALLVSSLRGATLTSITLLGLAVATVLVVDEVIRDVTAVQVGLGADGTPPQSSRTAVVGRAIMRSRSSLTYSTLIALVAVVPFVVLAALTTSFTRPMALTYAMALIASVAVSLTLTPVLGSLLLDGRPSTTLAGHLRHAYLRVTKTRAWRPVTGAVVAGVLALAALSVLPQARSNGLLPTLHDRDVLVQLSTAPGTSLPETDRITARIAKELQGLDGVAAVGMHVGRAVTSDQQSDVDSAEVWVRLDDQAPYGTTWDAIHSVVDGYPGVAAHEVTYGADQIATQASASSGALTVRLFGQNLEALTAKAQEVRDRIGQVAGVSSPTVEKLPVQPVAHVTVDLAQAEKYGLRPGDVRRETTTLTSGLTVGSLYEQAKVFDVVVRGVPSTGSSVDALKGMLIDTPSGTDVPLSSVASVDIRPEPTVIRHEDVVRSLDVTAGIDGRDASAVVADVQAQLVGLTMPAESHLQVLSAAQARQASARRGLIYGAGVLLIAYLLLQAATRSWRRAALLVVAGGLGCGLAALVTPLVGGVQTAGALAAVFATLLLTVRHGLMLVRQIMVDEVAGTDTKRASTSAAAEQVVPVLCTTLVLVAVLLPIAVLGDRAGLELLRPFAVTAVGGVLGACIVALVVLPLLLPVLAPARRPRVIDLTDEPSIEPANRV
ncbi:MAG: efflux RND transporter permease subunit [Actinomycetes bacterium]